jgi:dienelactone hydrolase
MIDVKGSLLWAGIVLAGVLAGTGCQRQNVTAGLELQAEDYAKARAHFQTHLLRHGPSPQSWTPSPTPAGAALVNYSTNPALKAWISAASPGKAAAEPKRPAVLFLHGGFAADADDWQMAQPYRDAGYVVMLPLLRGENGQPGDYTMFYNEVEDVLAAANYLVARPDVDATHLYLAGHSVGGTLVLLAAMTTDRFRGAASFSGSPDQIAWSKGQQALIPFDTGDMHEFQMRSPIAFATSFKCPVRIYYGSREKYFDSSSRRTASLAQQKQLDVEAISVPGDHFGAVPEEIQQSIKFFRTK